MNASRLIEMLMFLNFGLDLPLVLIVQTKMLWEQRIIIVVEPIPAIGPELFVFVFS